MDHPYENTMLLPANYAVIPEDEMTYLGGGEEIILARIGNTYLTLDTEQAAQFCMNVVVNFGYLLTNASFNYIRNLYQSVNTNGLSLAGTIYHTWGKLATPASKAAAIGVVGLAGISAGLKAYSIYNSLKNIYDDIFNPMPDFSGAETAAAA